MCVQLQEQGCYVRALLHREGVGPWDDAVICDLGAAPLPTNLMRGLDGVFHLAGIAHTYLTGKDECAYSMVNVDGTNDLLEAAGVAGVPRFVYFSSVKAAADPGHQCVDETWGEIPSSQYGLSKRRAEALVLAAGLKFDMHVSILRPTLVYGAGVKGNLEQMATAISSNRFPPLPDFGNRRSMIMVDDLVAAAVLAMDHPEASGEIYIVADGVEYSTAKLYEAMYDVIHGRVPNWRVPLWILTAGAVIGDVLGRVFRIDLPLNSEVLSRLSDSACYRSDKLRNDLGWVPEHDFFDVLPAIVESTAHS